MEVFKPGGQGGHQRRSEFRKLLVSSTVRSEERLLRPLDVARCCSGKLAAVGSSARGRSIAGKEGRLAGSDRDSSKATRASSCKRRLRNRLRRRAAKDPRSCPTVDGRRTRWPRRCRSAPRDTRRHSPIGPNRGRKCKFGRALMAFATRRPARGLEERVPTIPDVHALPPGRCLVGSDGFSTSKDWRDGAGRTIMPAGERSIPSPVADGGRQGIASSRARSCRWQWPAAAPAMRVGHGRRR